MVMRHLAALQTVDIVGQMLGHIANVDPLRAIRQPRSIAIGMCELKARLFRPNV